jgi:MFS family permease
MVAMTVSMLTTPWLLSRYGYRRTYAGTMLLLMAGGIVGGLANHFSLVLGARVAEGLAAGVVQPIPAIIIMRAFGPHEQGRASGLFGMGVVLAPALAPASAACWSTCSAGARSFSWWCPCAWYRCGWPTATCPTPRRAAVAANRNTAMIDWRGLLLGAVGTLCLLNGMVELHGGGGARALACWAARSRRWLLLSGGSAAWPPRAARR